MTLAEHWLHPGNTTQYLCRTNLAASCDCYVTRSFSRTAPVELDRHRRVAYFFLHALQALFVCRHHRATIAPVAHVVWSHNCACCVCYRGLLCCCSTDDRTRVGARYAGACTHVKCGGLFEPLMSHHSATFVNNFVFALYFVLIVLCGIIYLYISPSGHNNYIKLYSAWKSGKLN
jgi:hypothetical protein